MTALWRERFSMNTNSFFNGSRLDNLFSWLAASVVVAGAVVFAIKREEKRQQQIVPVAPSPAQEPLEPQGARARQAGRRGRAAGAFAIPWRGWKDILWRSYQNIQ